MVRYKFLRIVVALLVVTSLAACTNPISRQPLSCDQILVEPLQSLDFDSLGREHFPTWVVDTFDIPLNEVVISEYVPGESTLTENARWAANGIGYSAEFVGSELRRIEVQWNSTQPTGNEILDCFGSPAQYSAFYRQAVEVKELDLQLWYPQEGMVFRTYILSTRVEPPRIGGETSISHVILTRPAPVDEMGADVHIIFSPELRQRFLQVLKPWPGSWETVEIDVGFNP